MSNSANVERFSGFAKRYDAYRLQSPVIIADILTQLAQVERPQLVVDLGSGTGLSSCVWAERAAQVIGVEPKADMRRQAEIRTAAQPNVRNIRYVDADSTATGLADGCADIVTCSQSLHWMEPEPTFAEIARILRVGGVFAAYDCDWPPTMNWETELAWANLMRAGSATGQKRGWYRGVEKWAKEKHLARMEASGRFRFVREIVVHNTEMGNAERCVGLALSQGELAELLKHGMSETEIGLDEFRAVCERTIGAAPIPWYFSYRVRLGIK
ncbi:MAG: class I SAM-dependent methyltransferase [Chloroflexi bacterium]|nr:class I SAM-dependent methyltransferase [Chloroflexota bacterium]